VVVDTEPIVYVVDDDEAVRDSLKLLLETHGIVVEAYRSSEEFARSYMPGDGFSAAMRHREPSGRGAADTLLSAAREQGALLVMGGYGHSRLREWIFGGFTQRILRQAEIPVLMAH
jgi:nucleotide-binding universal stress UspA family protein